MTTVTLPEKEYQTLKKKASLYERVLRVFPEKIFGLDSYSNKQVKEFLKTDRLDPQIAKHLKKLLQ